MMIDKLILTAALTPLFSAPPTTVGSLLEGDHLVVMVKRDCIPCQRYIKALWKCGDAAQKRLAVVSLDSPAQARQWRSEMRLPLKVHVMNDPTETSTVTPTSYRSNQTWVGERACNEAF